MKSNSNTKYKEENINFLKSLADEEGVFDLPKGIKYRVLKSGNGPSPTPRSIVSVYYKGMLISGKTFDDNTTQGYPDAFRLNDLIVGWQIALPRMHVGDKWILYVPSEMGYGAVTTGGIPKNSTLIFEIELAGVS